ncbi:MAG TPA: nicotinate (nicotinamide) nucleotide adenylyltransferase [Flavobacteriaceae bacterium]|nr:nicotinate (nicotinamide) nucleotide adenylyltransferase [Flavobacteriaceae bacterium]
MKKKIGLFFGTFNPVHVGHLIIANHFVEYSDLDEVWFVVTPHNPFKKKSSLLDNYQRLDLVYRATEDFVKLRPSNIEFNLPQPNYTSHTLAVLEEKYPEKEFSLILGEDNLRGFHKWKNSDVILERHELFVYPRVSDKPDEYPLKNHPKVHFIDAPVIEISASFIRASIKEGKNVRPLIPYEAWKYLDEMNFYK